MAYGEKDGGSILGGTGMSKKRKKNRDALKKAYSTSQMNRKKEKTRRKSLRGI